MNLCIKTKDDIDVLCKSLQKRLASAKNIRRRCQVFESFGFKVRFTGRHPKVIGTDINGNEFVMTISCTPVNDSIWNVVASRNLKKYLLGINNFYNGKVA